jgi:hypothetical protein
MSCGWASLPSGTIETNFLQFSSEWPKNVGISVDHGVSPLNASISALCRYNDYRNTYSTTNNSASVRCRKSERLMPGSISKT